MKTVTSTATWKGCLRALLYNLVYHPQPGKDVANVVRGITNDPHQGMTKDTYVQHIEAALASSEDLGKILPDSPSDPEIRVFLADVLSQLR